MTTTKSDSDAPKVIARLQDQLKAQDEKAQEDRFRAIEKRLQEVEEMSSEHNCLHENEFPLIQKSLDEAKEGREGLRKKFEELNTSRVWSVAGAIIGLILAAIGVAYAYGENKADWGNTAKKVEKIEITVTDVSNDVRGMKTSFTIMENEQKITREKLDKVATPEQIEEAVRRGMKK